MVQKYSRILQVAYEENVNNNDKFLYTCCCGNSNTKTNS